MTDYKLVPVEPTPKMLQVWKSMHGYSRYNKYQAMLDAAPTVQAEPVSAQVRYRRPEKNTPDWSEWQPAAVNTAKPTYYIDGQGWEVEYRLLYDAPQLAEQKPAPELTPWEQLDYRKMTRKEMAGYIGQQNFKVTALQKRIERLTAKVRNQQEALRKMSERPAPNVAGLVEALEEISDPIRFMKERLEEGEQLNGMAAVQLAEDASYLRGIARAGLAVHRKGGA